MSSYVDRPVVARLAPFVALLLARWYDREIMLAAQQRGASTFDMMPAQLAMALGSVLTAGLVLAIGILAWRSRSVALGLGYALIGAVVVFDVSATFLLANGVPWLAPALSEPIAARLYDLWSFLYGPLGAATTVGGGMLVVGLAVLVRAAWERRAGSPSRALEARPAQG